MEQLLEDYKRRLKAITDEIDKGYDELTDARLRTKASCYRTFMSEIEKYLKGDQGKEDSVHLVSSVQYSYHLRHCASCGQPLNYL